ncbi:MAG: HEAT repeat domain-containing protein, partial [Myxococcaceae bacterium]|nr:HEAT repeat domain-containing protein [Myxococcaceae bacterium]
MDPLKRIVELLEDESPRKRIAAAVVLGELKVKDAAVVARLVDMAKDPVDAYAEAAVEALGAMGAMKALPVLLETLGRKGLQPLASKAIAALGEDALPEIKARLGDATPEMRAALSQLLPAVGTSKSFEMALEGMRGQPWETINKVALSVRAEAKAGTEAERRVMRTQVEKFIDKKKTQEEVDVLRGALKVLGYLELPDTEKTLLEFLGRKQVPLVRVEAATALRFAMGANPSKKVLRTLIDLLEEPDSFVARAARDSLTVMKMGPEFADELAELCSAKSVDVSLWAIGVLGGMAETKAKLVAKTLAPVARGGDRTRAEAASKILAGLPGGQDVLVEALADAEEEAGAQVLAEVLNPLAAQLSKGQVKKLLAAAGKQLSDSFAVARRQLEPVRNADPEGWAELLREKVKALQKKDPARADAIAQLLGRSTVATEEDKYGFAVAQLQHHSLDPHPRARQRDPVLAALEKLHAEGFKVAETVNKDKKLSDEARYYVGVHFAEKPQFELKSIGAEILEALAESGRSKMAKAAKNK